MQLTIFDTSSKSEELSEEFEPTPLCDKIMEKLEKWNKELEAQNIELQEMLDELQEGWSDEEKLQVNNPKEYARLQKENIEPIMPKELFIIHGKGNSTHLHAIGGILSWTTYRP